MLSKKDIELCGDIRRYGKFIARYDRNIRDKRYLTENNEIITHNYDETDSIMVYEYENQLYYIVMNRGEFIDYFLGGY